MDMTLLDWKNRRNKMAKIYTSADQLIGKTPLLELVHMEKEEGLETKILEKLEYFKDVLGISSWSDVTSDFDESVFAGLPEAEEDPFDGRTDISQAEFSAVAPQKLEKTEGYECLPEVTVTLDGKELVNDVDYDLVYADNTDPGTGRIIAVGLGEYIGIAKTEFTIE